MENATRIARIFIVDDHPLVREGLKSNIASHEDLEVCGEAEEETAALQAITETNPDVVIVDINLKAGSGMDLMKRLKTRTNGPAMLAMSMYDERLYAERAIRAGALGYISKQESVDQIIRALRQVLAGRVYLSEAMADSVLKQVHGGDNLESSPLERLSDRELQVFELLGQGLSTRAIAERLHLSHKTIENYREYIKSKLNLKDGIELMHQAFLWHLEQNRSV